ncbi:MAG TPA: TRC40/GET3/ArsA family transport-energizing ATPase, partial [Candidatus Paceibacterota bacterium]|nr:TRC40/GET3/ArsA family transport-energizing ATPase [Candidatus Paceibacterota bacterium]
MTNKKRSPPRSKSKTSSANRSLQTAFPSARFIFFGGKGGVGKTTAAAAAALYSLDRARADEQILVFSTDPAHSLSDSFELEIGDRFVEVARRGKARVVAREMDSSSALAAFKKRHRATLAEIADRGTLLDKADINDLLDLSLPGLDEVMALFELSECDRREVYSRVVVDTAPSGHTSRLLKLPELFSHWIDGLYRMSDKHRFMLSRFGHVQALQNDPVEVFLRDLVERLDRVRAMLSDPSQAAFTLITIPDSMSVEETSRYMKFLLSEEIPVTNLIINRVESARRGCAYCSARSEAQKPLLKEIARDFGALRTHLVPLLPDEIRGIRSLRAFARLVWQGEELTYLPSPARLKSAGTESPGSDGPEFILEPKRLLIFGGKGGVGKTTSAAAAALALAETNSHSRVLVLSSDPAHSLSDSFGEQIGRLKQRVAGLENLDGMEIDAAAQFEEFKDRYRAWI